MMTVSQGRQEGETRKLAGMNVASQRKERRIKLAQLAMLDAGMGRPDRSCSSDDMPTDLAAEYADGGKWVGAAVAGTLAAKLVQRIGNRKSARPSRHSTEIKLWRIRDDSKALAFMQELRLWLERNPPEPEHPLFAEAAQ